MTIDAPDWRSAGLYAEVGGEFFFPEKGESLREGRTICAVCTVRAECLRFALDNNIEYGLYGGTNPMQRRRLKKVAA